MLLKILRGIFEFLVVYLVAQSYVQPLRMCGVLLLLFFGRLCGKKRSSSKYNRGYTEYPMQKKSATVFGNFGGCGRENRRMVLQPLSAYKDVPEHVRDVSLYRPPFGGLLNLYRL